MSLSRAEKIEAFREYCFGRDCSSCPFGSAEYDCDSIKRGYTSDGVLDVVYQTVSGCQPEKEDPDQYDRWTDNQKIHPSHYNDSKISPFDVWDDWKLDPYTATAVKYIKRAGSKAGESAVDDLEKAIDYLKEKVQRLKEGQIGSRS